MMNLTSAYTAYPPYGAFAASTATGAGESRGSLLPSSLLDELGCSLVICDGRGRPSVANVAARRALAETTLLVLDAAGLRRGPGVSGDLDGALSRAAQRGRRSLVRLVREGDQLLVTVSPLQSAGPQPLPSGAGTQVLVMLGRSQPCSDLGLELLAGSYGLTLAERRVLAALLREATPREIAAAHAVALSTVRTQIASIREKFGARTVEGLLLQVAQLPPLGGALLGAPALPALRAAA